jgi:hypothetical protein
VPLRCLSFHHNEQLFDALFPQRSVLLFDPRVERSLDEIGERFRQLDAAKRRVDLLVLRGSGADFLERVQADPVLPGVVGEIPTLVLVGSHDRQSPDPALVTPSWSQPAGCPVEATEFRGPEMLTAVLSSKAVFAQDGVHFLLPSSSSHAEAFIRLADALYDHTDLLRLADWILPYLAADGTALVADTGSLLGLLSTVALEAQRRFGCNVPIATLNEYPVRIGSIERIIENFQAQDWRSLLFLISVSSSGTMASRVGAIDGLDAQVVVLLETATDGGALGAQSFAQFDVNRWTVGDGGRCERCKDLQLVIVDPQTYEVRTNLRWTLRRPDMEEANRSASFWEAVDRADAVALHYEKPTAEGNPAGRRHLAVALDVAALLTDSDFRARAVGQLQTVDRPDLVIVPRHDATDELRALAVQAFGLDPSQVIDVAFGELDAQVVDLLKDVGCALILDDVLISGSTLLGLRDRIYRQTQRAEHDLNLWAFVVVSRPASPADKRHVRNRFGTRPPDGSSSPTFKFAFAHDLLLPEVDDCPWCTERHMLEERLASLQGNDRERAEQRLAFLRPVNGLAPPLLFGGDGDFRTIGSFFGEVHSRAAFAAASALGQYMKCKMESSRAGSEVQVLDVPLIVQAFYDSLLVAGLLRTLDQRDVRDYGHDVDIAGVLRDPGGRYRAPTLAEFALAAIEQKLPAAAVRALLADHAEDPDVAFLLALMGGS